MSSIEVNDSSPLQPRAVKRFRPPTCNSFLTVNDTGTPPTPTPPRVMPLVVSLPNNVIFETLSIAIRRDFLNKLASHFPNASPRIGSNGDLFITPANPQQKSDLLAASSIGDCPVSVNLSRAEREHKRIIHGIPVTESNESIRDELKHLGAAEVSRKVIVKDGLQHVTESVNITFSSPPPSSAFIAAKFYPLMEIRWRPIQCVKCWSLGHTSRLCRKGDRCKSCALAHDPATSCSGPPHCINCKSPNHLSNSRSCPAYIQKQKILDFAQKYGLSFQEAKSNLYSPQPPSLERPSPTPPSLHPAPSFSLNQASVDQTVSSGLENSSEIKSQILALQAEVTLLKEQIKPLLPLQKAVEIILANSQRQSESLSNLERSLMPIIPIVQSISNDIPVIKQICELVRNSPQACDSLNSTLDHIPSVDSSPPLSMFSSDNLNA